jgi:signal transduction histidine kinase
MEEKQTLRPYQEVVAALRWQFEEKVRELSTIRRIGDALAHSLELENVCTMILDAVIEGMGGETGVLILFESSKRVPMVEVVLPSESQDTDGLFYPNDTMVESVLMEKRPLLIRDLSEATRSFGDGLSFGGSAMTLPLLSRGLEIGVIGLGHSEKNAFRPDQIPAGHLIATQAAISLENVKLLHELIGINEHLEAKVLERTMRLQETNQRLVELQDQLIQAEKMKVIGQLTAGIGHNLRSPLTIILSTTDLIKLHSDGNQKVATYAEKIAQQGKRMAGIVENLMEKCHKTQRREVERLNINHILEKELSFLEGNLEFKHNVVKAYQFDPDLPEVDGFYGDFSQTFVNLINNAVDAMFGSEIKELMICTRHDRNHIYVDVQDSGCGIPEDARERIFDFAFTTKAMEHERGQPSGVGIGLFNSKHLMSRYGAEIRVRSRPGETIFTVQIPWHR